MARVFQESGLSVTLPEQTSFRFAECGAYVRLSGLRISEMDVGWWDEGRKVMCLLELKDYSDREPQQKLLPKFVAKGRDCLVMLQAVWRNLGEIAHGFGVDLPEPCRKPQKLRLFFVLKVGPAGLSREALTPMKDTLQNEINAYAALLGIRSLVVLLLDHHTAILKGLPVSLPDTEPSAMLPS